MKAKLFLGSVLIFLAPVLVTAANPQKVLIYTYDSFLAKGGLGPAIFPAFEAKYHCKIEALAAGDGGQILTKLKLSSAKPDLVLGIDQNLWPAFENYSQNWNGWRPKDFNKLLDVTFVADGFVPFDYGVFAFVVDTQKLKADLIPKSWKDLNRAELSKKILIEDPRTSSPGLGFIKGAEEVFGEKNATEFFSAFSKQWLTLPSGWSQAYGMFLKGEAPLVWSYTTSEAYHRAHGDKERRYRAVEFKEGHPLQIEGAVLIKNDKRPREVEELARNFLDYLISEEVQKMIPEKNWMFPARKNVALPESFNEIPKPKVLFKGVKKEENLKSLLKTWELSSLRKK